MLILDFQEKQLKQFWFVSFKNSRIFDWAEKALRHSHKEKADLVQSSTESLGQRLKQIESRFEKLYDDKIDGKITEDFYNSKLSQYTLGKEQALTALAKSSGTDSRYTKLNGHLFTLSQRAKDLYSSCKDINRKRLILKFIYKDIGLGNDRMLVAEYTDAFKLLVEVIKETNGSNVHIFSEKQKKKFEPPVLPLTKTKNDPCKVVSDSLLRALEEVRTSLLKKQKPT